MSSWKDRGCLKERGRLNARVKRATMTTGLVCLKVVVVEEEEEGEGKERAHQRQKESQIRQTGTHGCLFRLC